MNIQKRGVDILLALEGIALIIVLVIGLLSAATSTEPNQNMPSAGSEQESESESYGEGDSSESENVPGTEIVPGTESESESESTTEPEGNPEPEQPAWVVPDTYVEAQITFSDGVEAKIAAMTIEQKIAQLFMVTPEQLTGYNRVTAFGNASKNAFNKNQVAGLVYSMHNYQNTTQMKNLVYNADAYSRNTYGISLFTLMQDDTAELTQDESTFATTHRFNLLTGTGNDVLAIHNAGMTALVKNFMNSNTTIDDAHMVQCKSIVDGGAKMIVLGKHEVPGLLGNAGVPCNQSDRVIGLIRNGMGYTGILVAEGLTEATDYVTAIKSGMDMIMVPGDYGVAYNQILQAVNSGEISQERLHNALGRILTVKGI